MIRPLLRIAAAAYRAAVGLRNARYDRWGSPCHSRIPVLSVGNLAVGGTGKTPLVAWLAERLYAAGRRPAVVSRGYRGRAGRGPLVVTRGDGPLCPVEHSGDEPFLLARSLHGVPVVVGSDRFAAAETAADHGAGVVILDDGFQHRRLHRDLDLVLLEADAPFGNGRLLPAGPLRESPMGLARAHVLVLTRSGPADAHTAAREALRRFNPSAPIVRAGHRSLGFIDGQGRPHETPKRAVAFCAIGNPQRFEHDLVALGVEIAEFRRDRDHHPYSAADLDALRRAATRHGALLVTTEKDLVRLGPAATAVTVPLLALRIAAVVHDPQPLDDAVRCVLDAPRPLPRMRYHRAPR